MPHYGKFRGKVVNNIDPLMLGRLVTLVPAISELPLSWALPCVPFAGLDVGFFALPPIGANVWIEFEGGDPNYPIWTGCFWGEEEVPAKPALPTTVMLKTNLMTITLNDLLSSCKLELKAPTGLYSVELSATGITLTANTVSVSVAQQAIDLKNLPSTVSVAPQGVSIKNGTASVNITPATMELKNAAASVELTPASIGIKNGAASVDLSPASVSLNKGALEVI